MSDTPNQNDWSKPAAMAIPKGGYFADKVEQGVRGRKGRAQQLLQPLVLGQHVRVDRRHDVVGVLHATPECFGLLREVVVREHRGHAGGIARRAGGGSRSALTSAPSRTSGPRFKG